MKTFKPAQSVLPHLFILAAVLALGAVLIPTYVFAEPAIETRRTRVLQVSLDQHPKISQYLDINSTDSGYGKNACGLVAAAAAVGGDDWDSVVGLLHTAAGSDYGPDTGIQPSKYVAALEKVFGESKITAYDDSTLERIYDELAAGNIVIVDVRVNANAQHPSADAPNYAHFARVLGMDMTTREIFIENTLRGEPYWTLSLADFAAVWTHPETAVSEIPDPARVEDVTNWMVVMDSSLVQTQDL